MCDCFCYVVVLTFLCDYVVKLAKGRETFEGGGAKGGTTSG